MLTLALSACLTSYVAYAQTCSNTGKEPAVNSGTNNYIIDTLEILQTVIPFPYAINQCTPHSLTGEGPYYKHFCISSTEAVTQIFSDSSCETNVTDEITLSQGSPGEVGYFECSGDDTYAKFQLGETQGTDACPDLQVIYAGLAGCVNAFSAVQLKYSIYCGSTSATFEWFAETKATGRSGEESGSSGSGDGSKETTTASPWSSWLPSSTEDGESGSSSYAPLETTVVNTAATCNSQFYCFDWTLSSSCQKIDGSPGSSPGVWGIFEECSGTSETLTGAAVNFHFNALLIVVVAIVAALTQ